MNKNEHFRRHFFAFNINRKKANVYKIAREICVLYGENVIFKITAYCLFLRFKNKNFDFNRLTLMKKN